MDDPQELSAGGVRFEVDGAVATVVLDRPSRRNAQTPAMWAALAEIGERLPDAVRVVVLRGEGTSFSAGLDRRMFESGGVPGERTLVELARLDDDALAAQIEIYQRAFTWWRRPEIVTVAAVQGHAVGAGLQLALACDLRVLADDAQLTMLEPALGLVPDLGGTKPLVELVGYARALEICATARPVGAEEADAIGLATIVVPTDELVDATGDLVDALSAAPHDAVTGTKRLLLAAAGRTHVEQRAAEREEQVARLRDLAARAAEG